MTVEEGYLKSKYGSDLDSCTRLMSMSDFMLYKIIKKRREDNEKKKVKESITIPDKIKLNK